MVVIVSPSRGYFIGCAPCDIGGVKEDAQFSWDIDQAIDLSLNGVFNAHRVAGQHLSYTSKVAHDVTVIEGNRQEIEQQAAVMFTHSV